jgi:uncharacterized membrane protein
MTMMDQDKPALHLPILTWERILLWLLLLAGAALRFWELGEKSLVSDEVQYADMFLNQGILYPLTHFGVGQNHPGYSVPTRLLMEVLGRSEFALRFVPAALGVAALAAAWALGRALSGRLVGFGLMILLIVSCLPLAYARQARGYAGSLFGSVLAAYFLYTAWTRAERARWWGYAGALVVAVYSHLYSGLAMVALGLWLTLQWLTSPDRSLARARFRQYLMATGAAVGLLAILYAPAVAAYRTYATGGQWYTNLQYTPSGLLQLLDILGPRLPSNGVLFLVGLAILGAATQARRWRQGSLALLWLVVPLLILWLSRFYVTKRFLIFLAPAYLLLIVWGAVALGRWLGRWRKAAPAWLSALILVATAGAAAPSFPAAMVPVSPEADYLYRYYHWRGIADYLATHGSEEDVLAVVMHTWMGELPAAVRWYRLPRRAVLLNQSVEGLEQWLAQYDRPRRTWWLVMPPPATLTEALVGRYAGMSLLLPTPGPLSRQEALASGVQVLESLWQERRADPKVKGPAYQVARPLAAAYLEWGRPAEAVRTIKETPDRPWSDWPNDILLAQAMAALGEPCNARQALDSAQRRAVPLAEWERYGYLTYACPNEGGFAPTPLPPSPEPDDPYKYYGWRKVAEYLAEHGSEEDVLVVVTHTPTGAIISPEGWYRLPGRAVLLIQREDDLERWLAQYDRPRRTWWLVAPPHDALPQVGTWGGLTLLLPSAQALPRSDALASGVQVLESLFQERRNKANLRASAYLLSRPLAAAYLESGKPDEAIRVIKATPNRPAHDWQNDILLARARAALGEPCSARIALDSAKGRGAPADVLEQYAYLTKGCPPRK